MVKMMTHMAVTVVDMEETLQFYEAALGFHKIFELNHPETGDPWIVYIQICAGQFLELFYGGTETDRQTGEPAGFSHICFAVEDVEKTAQHIVKAGYELEIPPCRGCDSNMQAWIRDPNGVRIELMQIMEESPHAAFM